MVTPLAPRFAPSEVTLKVAPDAPVYLRPNNNDSGGSSGGDTGGDTGGDSNADHPNGTPAKLLKIEVAPSGIVSIMSHANGQWHEEMGLHVADAFENERAETTFVHDGVPAFQITTGNIYAPSLTIQLDNRWAVSPAA